MLFGLFDDMEGRKILNSSGLYKNHGYKNFEKSNELQNKSNITTTNNIATNDYNSNYLQS